MSNSNQINSNLKNQPTAFSGLCEKCNRIKNVKLVPISWGKPPKKLCNECVNEILSSRNCDACGMG